MGAGVAPSSCGTLDYSPSCANEWHSKARSCAVIELTNRANGVLCPTYANLGRDRVAGVRGQRNRAAAFQQVNNRKQSRRAWRFSDATSTYDMSLCTKPTGRGPDVRLRGQNAITSSSSATFTALRLSGQRRLPRAGNRKAGASVRSKPPPDFGKA